MNDAGNYRLENWTLYDQGKFWVASGKVFGRSDIADGLLISTPEIPKENIREGKVKT